jgi:hypothetical protein
VASDAVTYGPGVFAIGLVNDGITSVPFLSASFTSATLLIGAPTMLVNFDGTTYDLSGFALSGLAGPGSFGMNLGSTPEPVFDGEQQLVAFGFPVTTALVADDADGTVPEPGVTLLALVGGAVLARRVRRS